MGSHDELIGDTLAMVNIVREAFGKDRLNELPNAKPGDAGDCLFHRAFADLGVTSVTGDTASFSSSRVASAIGTLWGTPYDDETVHMPKQFGKVVQKFDSHELSHYDV